MKFATYGPGRASFLPTRRTGGNAASEGATNTARPAHSMRRMSDVAAQEGPVFGDCSQGDEA